MSSFASLKQSRDARHRALPSHGSGVRADGHHTTRQHGSVDEGKASSSACPIPTASQLRPDVPTPEAIRDLDIAELYNLPSTLCIKQSPTRGRGLYAATSLKPGQTLHTTKPLTSALSTQHLSDTCSSCHLNLHELSVRASSSRTEPPKRLLRCTGCRIVHYCSVECQTADWTVHKPECTAFQTYRKQFAVLGKGKGKVNEEWMPHESVRALGRLCWERKQARGAGVVDPDWWQQIEALESHFSTLPPDRLMPLAALIRSLQQYLSASSPSSKPASMESFGFSSTKELLHLASAFQVNAHTLSSPSLSPLGAALSPVLALANHSCEPNAVVVFPRGGAEMRLVSIRDIQPGEEILTSYVDVSLPGGDRRKELRERYGFDCACTLCQRERGGWVDPRWCVLHVGCGPEKGKGKMPDGSAGAATSACDACGEVFKVDTKVLGALVEKSKELLKAEDEGRLDPSTALPILKTLLPALSTLLPPSSHPLLPLLRLHALLLSPPSSLADLRAAASSLGLAYEGGREVYPEGHPVLGLILAEWGKMLSVDLAESGRGGGGVAGGGGEEETTGMLEARLGRAAGVLKQGLGALRRGFGEGGLVEVEVGGLVEWCEAEVRMRRAARVGGKGR